MAVTENHHYLGIPWGHFSGGRDHWIVNFPPPFPPIIGVYPKMAAILFPGLLPSNRQEFGLVTAIFEFYTLKLPKSHPLPNCTQKCLLGRELLKLAPVYKGRGLKEIPPLQSSRMQGGTPYRLNRNRHRCFSPYVKHGAHGVGLYMKTES